MKLTLSTLSRRLSILLTGMMVLHNANAQSPVVSGPMLGHTELRTATLWMELKPGFSGMAIVSTNGRNDTALRTTEPSFNQQIERYTFTQLEPGQTYAYRILVRGSRGMAPVYTTTGTFSTLPLWQWRRPAPEFSFLAGSCAYFNEPPYDRPGKPYGGDSSIFETMAKEKAAFMLWLGDNWYTREVDYYSVAGLNRRAQQTRSQPVLQNLWKAMPQYAAWDDHDYGPNDADRSFILKNESRDIFKRYWANPSYGNGREGVYTKITWNDVDLFLLDDRTWRTNDNMPDSINGQPTDKTMFGKEQMDWLKSALLQSQTNASIRFRIVVSGSQVLNPVSPFDKFAAFPTEYNDFMQFLAATSIKGLLFFSGDRHHSEIIKVDRPGTYPLYDVTSSPLTSGTHKFSSTEAANPYRLVGVDQLQNYSRFTVKGDAKNRSLVTEFIGIKGDVLGKWEIRASELQ